MDSALRVISDGFRSTLDAVRDAVSDTVLNNPDYPWTFAEVKALVAETRMADMFDWLGGRGHDVSVVGDEGIRTGRYWMRPYGIGTRIGVYRCHGNDIEGHPRAEFDLLAWVDGHPVVGEAKSGRDSFSMRKDVRRKLTEFRRVLYQNGDEGNYMGPAVIMGVPDDHELVFDRAKSMRLYEAGGRVLRLKTTWGDLDSYAGSLCRGLGIGH